MFNTLQSIKQFKWTSNIFLNVFLLNLLQIIYFYNNNNKKKLIAQFGVNEVPFFPKKSFLPLSVKEKEERKTHLEKYLQKS